VKKFLPALAAGAVLATGVFAARAAIKPAAQDPLVTLNTSKGAITIRVYQKEAPITAGNFLDLVKRGFYKNMVFHRVVPDFVVQTGDPTGTGQGGFIDPKTKQERTIKLETKPNLLHDGAGVVAMARTQDPNSASSQFYITLAATPFLDGQYAVFGRVEKGLDVVKKIAQGDKFISAKLVTPAKKAARK
jgi:cyclophilin family peptidyl-prolyl cis-trans isomerase